MIVDILLRREAARAKRDYATADSLRTQLRHAGVTLEDKVTLPPLSPPPPLPLTGHITGARPSPASPSFSLSLLLRRRATAGGAFKKKKTFKRIAGCSGGVSKSGGSSFTPQSRREGVGGGGA